MASLVALYLALWAAVGANTTVHELDGPVHFVDLYGNARETQGALGCSAGGAELYLGPSVDLPTLVHELAHAYDCQDDGTLNGSPVTKPPVRPDWASDYCWGSDIEWYACWATQVGRIHNGPLPPLPDAVPAGAPHPWLVQSTFQQMTAATPPATAPPAVAPARIATVQPPPAAAPAATPAATPGSAPVAASTASPNPPREPVADEVAPPASAPAVATQTCRLVARWDPDPAFMALGYGPYPLGIQLEEVCGEGPASVEGSPGVPRSVRSAAVPPPVLDRLGYMHAFDALRALKIGDRPRHT